MFRQLLISTLLLLACTSCATTGVTSFGFAIDISNAPPPPRLVLVQAPSMTVVEGTSVYVVNDGSVDYDLFRYSSSWYLCSGGYWYRASSYNGPFVVVSVRSVPRQVVELPPEHWRHHPLGGPPGQMKKRGGPGA